MENAVRLLVQDAIVELAAAALGASMLHEHVIIEMLAAATNKQTVDKALRAWAVEYGVNVVPYQSAAQKYGMRGDIGVAGLLDAQRGNIKGIEILALDQIVRDDGVVRGGKFGHRVG